MMGDSKYYVYILECSNGSFYIGFSQSVDKRFSYHLLGKGAEHTKAYRPTKLLWTEEHDGLLSALARERQLKRWTRRKKKALMQGDLNLLKKL